MYVFPFRRIPDTRKMPERALKNDKARQSSSRFFTVPPSHFLQNLHLRAFYWGWAFQEASFLGDRNEDEA